MGFRLVKGGMIEGNTLVFLPTVEDHRFHQFSHF